MLSSLGGARGPAAAARGGAASSSASSGGGALLPSRPALAPLSARRLSNAAACCSGRAPAPAPAAPRPRPHGAGGARRRPRGALTTAAAKRRSRGASKGDDEDGEPDEELMEDVLFQNEGRDGDDADGGVDGEIEAFDRFTSDDDDLDADEDEGDEGAVGEDEDEEADGWDAALVNFDEEQDAKDMTPSPEDLLKAKMRRLGRVDETPHLDIEVDDVTPPPPVARTEEDRLTALSVADAQRLTSNRAGYTAFKMDGCDLLVAETADGLYDLRDSFVFDEKSDLFNRCATDGAPDAPARFQCIPWAELGSGDLLKYKDPVTKVLKMYFVGVASTQPYRVDMDSMFVFDTSSRVLSRAPVTRVHENIQEPILRIRPEGITIEDNIKAPPVWVLLGRENWHGPMPEPDELGYDPAKHSPEAREAAYAAFAGAGAAGVATGGGGAGGAGAAVVEVVERGEMPDGLEDDSYVEDMPDVPAVDMM